MKEHYYSGMFNVFHCFFVKTSITFYYSLFRLSENLFPYIKYIFHMKKIITMIYEWIYQHGMRIFSCNSLKKFWEHIGKYWRE